MSLSLAPRIYPIGALVSSWRVFAQRNGVTDPRTVIDAEPADTLPGYWPAYVTTEGYRVILTCDAPAPTKAAARNRLRDLLWQAHQAGAIHLPVEQEAA